MPLSSVRMPTAGSTGPSIMQAITQNSIFNQFAKTRIFAAYDPTWVPSARGARINALKIILNIHNKSFERVYY